MAKSHAPLMKRSGQMYDEICERMRSSLTVDMHVLELACASGQLSFRLAGCVRLWAATDFSENMIAETQKGPCSGRLHFSAQDATALPYAPGSFDAVVISNALHIMPRPELALAEIKRVLKPEGTLYAPTFIHGSGAGFRLRARALALVGFKVYYKWTAEEYESFISEHNFQIIEIARLGGSLVPLCYLRGKGKEMMKHVWIELLLPFLGTSLGAGCVFFLKRGMNPLVQRALTGFAAGVMVAASVWSLLVPAMEQAADMGQWAFLPAVAGFWLGVLFLLALDKTIPHLHQNSTEPEGPRTRLSRAVMLVLAVTLHNIPEGMAVGVVLAGWIAGNSGITAAGTLALSIGIAIQNFPEGAIISMPLQTEGVGKGRAFLYGILSGVVEPLAAAAAIWAAGLVLPALPYLLSFAAGAMIYVVVEELIPEASAGGHSNLGTLFFAAGFSIMLALDVALG